MDREKIKEINEKIKIYNRLRKATIVFSVISILGLMAIIPSFIVFIVKYKVFVSTFNLILMLNILLSSIFLLKVSSYCKKKITLLDNEKKECEIKEEKGKNKEKEKSEENKQVSYSYINTMTRYEENSIEKKLKKRR